MSFNNSGDDFGHSYNNDELDNRMDTEKKMEDTPVSSGTRSRADRAEEARAPPGPACPKERHEARTGDPTPGTSRAGGVTAALLAESRSKRWAAYESNRYAALADRDQGDGDQTSICIDSDESEEDPSCTEKEKSPLKRRMIKEEGGEEPSSSEEVREKKRGRPQTTGWYVRRCDAREKDIRLKKEALEIEAERSLRKLTSRQVLTRHQATVEDKLDELSNAPTEDLAQRARESMAKVWTVAATSKNLKGGYIRDLKQAAAVGAASLEILSTRMESGDSESEALRQIEALRRELERTKSEVQAAKAEAERAKQETEKLRKELDEAKGDGRPRRRVRAVVEDSPPPSPQTEMKIEVDNPPPNTEITEKRGRAPPEAENDPPEYCDNRKRKEIMPPREEWPDALRPPIKGKIKVLEDSVLTGTRVKMVKDTRRPAGAAQQSSKGPIRSEAQALMELLAPMLKEWLRSNLSSLGLAGAADDSGKNDTRPAKKEKKGKETVPNTPHPAPGKTGKERGELHPTVIPNGKLWSAAVGSKTGGNIHPPLPTERRTSPLERERTPVATTSGTEAWTEVSGKRKKAKKTPTAEAKPQAGKGRQRGPNGAGQAQTRATATTPAPGKKAEGKKQGTADRKATARKPPRTAAVTLTCHPDGYADAMRTVRAKVNLKEIGIETLRPKRAATGAIILEVPGPDGADKAAVLREKMEEALRDTEGARVARPMKQSELRIKKILDSTTIAEIKEAISRISGCKVEEIRTGEIRRAPDGMGTLWVQCPMAAANKAATARKLELGWSNPTVEALEPRQMHCFKCLEQGHVQAVCPNPVDRRNLCYRCSREGHQARDCEYAPQCIICKERGQPSAHKMGGRACKAPKRKAGPPGRAKPPTAELMEVDQEEAPPAARGDPARRGRASAPGRRGKRREEHRPTVRGGTAHPDGDGSPVPARSMQTEEAMEVEVELFPATARPPQGADPPNGEKDEEASAEPGSSLHQGRNSSCRRT